MIKIAKYPPRVDEYEDQLKDLLNHYTYYIVHDDNNDMRLSFVNNKSFVVTSQEVSKKIDFAFTSFTAALQLQEDENHMVKEIAKLCVELKKPIKLVIKGDDNGIL